MPPVSCENVLVRSKDRKSPWANSLSRWLLSIALLSLVSVSQGSITFSGVPDPNTFVLHPTAGANYLIYGTFGGHFIQEVGAIPTYTKDSTGTHAIYTLPDVPVYQPYPYYDVNGNIVFPQMYLGHTIGTANSYLAYGQSYLVATGDWNLTSTSRAPVINTGLNFSFDVLNAPASFAASGDIEVFLSNEGNLALHYQGGDPFSTSLAPGHYFAEIYMQSNDFSGAFSLSIVPEVNSMVLSSAALGSAMVSLLWIRKHRPRS